MFPTPLYWTQCALLLTKQSCYYLCDPPHHHDLVHLEQNHYKQFEHLGDGNVLYTTTRNRHNCHFYHQNQKSNRLIFWYLVICTESQTALWKSFLISTTTKICAIPINLLFSHPYLPADHINSKILCFVNNSDIRHFAVDSRNSSLYYVARRAVHRYRIQNGNDEVLYTASSDISGEHFHIFVFVFRTFLLHPLCVKVIEAIQQWAVLVNYTKSLT